MVMHSAGQSFIHFGIIQWKTRMDICLVLFILFLLWFKDRWSIKKFISTNTGGFYSNVGYGFMDFPLLLWSRKKVKFEPNLKFSIFFKKISGRNRHHLSLAMVLERYSFWHSFMVFPFGTKSIHISDWFQLSVGLFLLLLLLLPFQQFQTHILDWAWEVFQQDNGLVLLLHGWFSLYFSNACPTGKPIHTVIHTEIHT